MHSSRVIPALHPPERPSHIHTPKPGFGGRSEERGIPFTPQAKLPTAMYIWPSTPPALTWSGRRLPRRNVTKFDLIQIWAFRRRALMHSIVIPSLPAFLTIPFFIASPTQCCPFLPLTPLQSPLKKARYPDAAISEVPSLFVSYSPMTSQPFTAQGPSRVSMCPIPLTPLTAAVRTLSMPNVSSSSRDSPWRPCVSCGRTSSPPASLVAFSEQIPSAFHSVPGVFYPGSCLRSSDVLGAALTPRLDLSIVSTFSYSRVSSEHFSSLRFESHVFRGGGVPTLLPQARLPRETISLCWGASPPINAVGRLALSTSTSSRINRCHKGTLINARTP